MKVKEIMTTDPETCDLNASLADAAKAMWDNDCGILPVLKNGKEIVGLITDRDICMGAAMRDRHPSAISVKEVISGEVYSVKPEEEVQQALATMQGCKVRRVPVIDSEGTLMGVLSMNDVVLNAKEPDDKKTVALSFGDVVRTYQAISEHPQSKSATANATK